MQLGKKLCRASVCGPKNTWETPNLLVSKMPTPRIHRGHGTGTGIFLLPHDFPIQKSTEYTLTEVFFTALSRYLALKKFGWFWKTILSFLSSRDSA